MSATCSVQHEYFSECWCFCTLTIDCKQHATKPCPQPTHSLTLVLALCGSCTALSAKQRASAAYNYLRKKREGEAHQDVEHAHMHSLPVSRSRRPDSLDPSTGKPHHIPKPRSPQADKLATPIRTSSSRVEKPVAGHGIKKRVCGPHKKEVLERQDRATAARAKLKADRLRHAKTAAKITQLSADRQQQVIKALNDNGPCGLCDRVMADCLASDRMCVA